MRIPIMNLDQQGILPDLNPHDLPLTAWSNGRNVRFINGRVEKALGYEVLQTPQIDADFALPVETANGYFWLYAGGGNIYAVKDLAHANITRSSPSYGGFVGNRWTGGVLNGVAILNQFEEPPQAWIGPDLTTKLQNLPNWPSNWRARSVRPFLNYLVALGVKEGANDNPYRVVWSHPADPGTVPVSWDITDPTRDCGDAMLADTDGDLVDQGMLRTVNIIYKTDSAYAMRHVGGVDIMGILPVKKADGLLMPNGFCDLEHRGFWHVVFGANDIYRHDGLNSESVFRKKIRDWIYRNIDSSYYKNSFISHNAETNEIYVCIPQRGKQHPNVAVVWNYADDSFTIKDLPEVSCMAVGRAVPDFLAVAADSWANASGTWATAKRPWGSSSYSSVTKRLVMFTQGAGRKAYLQDQGSTFSGAAVKSVLERIGLSVLGQDAQGKPIYDSDTIKIVTEVWPRFVAPKGTVLNVFVGSQMTQDDPIKWSPPFPFIAGSSQKVNPYVSGRIISMRFEIETNVHWSLSGYDLDIVSGGKY